MATHANTHDDRFVPQSKFELSNLNIESSLASGDFRAYTAKNVSNDHDFTKLFTPSSEPSSFPIAAPSVEPSLSPSNTPSDSPSNTPSNSPSNTPSNSPSNTPSNSPSNTPSISSSDVPTVQTSEIPTISPTFSGITHPSDNPPSNRPSAIRSDIPTQTTLFKTIHSCPEWSANTTDVSLLTKFEITFDYEIVTPAENVSISSALETLEGRVAQSVQENFLECAERRRKNMRELEESFGQIVRIDSTPLDVVDRIHVECIEDTGIALSGDMKCTPVIGSMTLYSSCETCPIPESEILNLIEESCDADHYVDAIIKQVNYIGTREPLTATQIINTTKEPSVSVGISSSMVIGMIAVAAIFTMFVLRRRKKRIQGGLATKDEDFETTFDFDEKSFELDEDSDTKSVNLSELLTINEEDDGGINVSPLPNKIFANLG